MLPFNIPTRIGEKVVGRQYPEYGLIESSVIKIWREEIQMHSQPAFHSGCHFYILVKLEASSSKFYSSQNT